MFASHVVDRGFKPGRVNSRTEKLVFDASLLSKQHQGERGRTGWLGMRKMCPSKAICLPMDCCFSHLAPYKSIKRVVTCSRHEMAEENNNHSLIHSKVCRVPNVSGFIYWKRTYVCYILSVCLICETSNIDGRFNIYLLEKRIAQII